MLGKFAFIQGKIVDINQVVEANSKVSLYICRIVHEINGRSKGIKEMLYWNKIIEVKYRIKKVRK